MSMLRTAFPNNAVTLTFSNPTIASVSALKQEERRASPYHGSAASPTTEIEAKFRVLAADVSVETLHVDYTTASDGTYTWQLRDINETENTYFLDLQMWRAVDYEET